MASTNQPISSGSIPFFPPPPKSATLAKEKTKRKSKSKSNTKSSSSSTTFTPLQRSRMILLPILLILTFTSLILGVIYAYCVASPHTNLTDAQLASPSDVEIDSSIFSRRDYSDSIPVLGPVPANIKRAATLAPDAGGDAAVTAAIIAAANTTTDETTRARQQSRPANKSSLSPALIFYTLTSPLLTILLVSAELMLALSSSSSSNSNSQISESIAPRPRSRFSGALTSHRAHLSLLALILLNITSLTITTSFWTHCELPSPAITRTAAICPKEVRGHWMGGIHEVSIAKITICWLIVIGLVCHAFFVWRNMKLERRRWALGSGHGQAEEADVTVKVEEADLEKGQKSSRVRFV